MPTLLDIRQSVLRAALPMVGSAVNDRVNTIFPLIDAELAKLYEDRNVLLTDGGLITFTGTQAQFTENLNLVFNSKIAGGAPVVVSLGSSTQTFANGDIWYATVNRVAGTATTAVASTLPTVVAANQEIWLIAKRVDAGDGTQRLYWRNGMALNAGQTVRLGASGSGSGSGGAGSDLTSLQYRGEFIDPFDDGPTSALSAVDVTAGHTDSTAYSAAKSLYQLNYDAGKTIAAGTTTTNINISANAAFTVKTGDMVIFGAQARRITAVSTQASFTTDAFDVAPTLAGQVTISQAVHTKDIYGLSVDGNSLFTAFAGASFSEILVDYEDTSTVGDNIYDVNTVPVIAYDASYNGTSFTNYTVRATNETDTWQSLTLTGSGTALYLRFFANKTSGAGSINILRYVAKLQKSTASSSGGVTWSAYATTNSSTTPVNCSISVAGGKTTITLINNLTYAMGVSPTTTYGSLDVSVNGQLYPRFLAGSTPATDGYFTEVSPTVIQLDKDYSSQQLDIQIIQRTANLPIDTTTSNTTGLAVLNTHLFKNYIINGNMDYWQRASSFSTPANLAYTADRYLVGYDGTIGTFTVSQQAFALGQTQVPNEPTWFYRWNQTAAGSGSTFRVIQTRMEGVRTLAGKTATFSFYMKADTARTVGVLMFQNFGAGGSPSASVVTATQNVNLTTNWQKYNLQFSIPSIAGKTLGTAGDFLGIQISLPINTTMTIDFAQAMLNEGGVAAPWVYASGGSSLNAQAEFAMCERFYQEGIASAGSESINSPAVAREIHVGVPFGIKMRGTPSVNVATTIIADVNVSSVSTVATGNIGFSFIANRSTDGPYQASRRYKADAEL